MSDALLTVRIGAYLWGVPTDVITEIIAQPTLTPIPQTAATVRGIAVVRGQPLPVLSPHAWWADPPGTVPLALRWATADGPVLIAVDAVEALWVPDRPALPVESWRAVVPADLLPLIAAVYRREAEWLWQATPQWPDLLWTGGVDHALA